MPGALSVPVLVLLSLPLCPPGNALRGLQPRAQGVIGELATLTDNRSAREGTIWNSPEAVILSGPAPQLVFDLGAPHLLRAMTLQADNDDAYRVEASDDDQAWRELWVAQPVPGAPGLRTRGVRFPTEVVLRYLRVRPHGGDGFYSVSDIRAFCRLPRTVAPPGPPPEPFLGFLNDERVLLAKAAVAFLGAVILVWGRVLARRGRPLAHRLLRDGTLAALGLLALAAWWNFGRFHFDNYVHIWDTYHYFVGAKYFPELGYTRLYDATQLAEAEAGLADEVETRRVRNLLTNHLEGTARILANADAVKSRFSPERWQAFKRDVLYFRLQGSRERWDEIMRDHGYNGSPAWAVLGRALASLAPASDAHVLLVALADPLLLLLMWGAVAWAFGWRTACVALLWWGANLPGRFWWNGGAFLRQDWLALLVIGICLLRKERWAAAGAALVASALLRVFPGFVLAGLALAALAHMLRERRLALLPAERRILAGAAGGGVLVVAFSFAAAGGVTEGIKAWTGFVENSEKHVGTPLTNHMGLKTLVGFDSTTRASRTRNETLEDPFEVWKEARRATFRRRLIVFGALLVGHVLLLARAVRGRPPWEAAVLSAGLIFSGSELTCYYYSFPLVFAFLWPEAPIAGECLAALSAVTALVPSFLFWDDERYTLISALVLAYLVLVTARAGQRADTAKVSEHGPAGPAGAGPAPRTVVTSTRKKRRRR